jgi:DNA-binding NarL/FixJ family response regulator
MIRLVIYEDNEDLRDAITFLIRSTPDLDLVGAFAQCVDVATHIEDLQPDVILMDIEMPVMDGLEATRIVKDKNPVIQVIMLTVFEDEESLFTALRNGASGYFLKGEPPSHILDGIRIVHAGGSVLTPKLARRVFNFFDHSKKIEDNSNLSIREKEILKLLVDGFSYKEIAHQLFISIETVRTHIRHIYEKMQVRSKSQAVGKALKDKMFRY